MRELAATVERWRAAGRRVALATVVEAYGSAPRPPGSKLAVADDGAVEGSVSGGCVEGAVVQAAEDVLAGGAARLLRFGIADDEAWAIGLPCGGEIAVWLDAAEAPATLAFARSAADGATGALVTRLDDGRARFVRGGRGAVTGRVPAAAPHPAAVGTLGGAALDAAGTALAAELLAAGRPGRRSVDGVELWVDVTAPAPRLIAFGAGELAVALCGAARTLGWRTWVCDPRGRWATPARFPAAAGVLVAWPDAALAEIGPLRPADAVVVLAHDPKLDDAALELALASGAGYVGALGSRRTQAARNERLRARGLEAADVDRIAGPIGLDLGAASPAETALSILAEIVAARHGRGGGRLRDAAGPIHDAFGDVA